MMRQWLFLILLPSIAIHAQVAAHPAPQTLTGCVARIPNTADKYVLASGSRCMLVGGTYKPAQIADREITVKGIVVEPSGMVPLTLNVQSVVSTQQACTKTCTLEPPGTRGIHGKEVPGKEGATRGNTEPTSPNPPN